MDHCAWGETLTKNLGEPTRGKPKFLNGQQNRHNHLHWHAPLCIGFHFDLQSGHVDLQKGLVKSKSWHLP
jgi:hypothetical protein